MVNNGSISYDHDRDGTHTMLGGCEVLEDSYSCKNCIPLKPFNSKYLYAN